MNIQELSKYGFARDFAQGHRSVNAFVSSLVVAAKTDASFRKTVGVGRRLSRREAHDAIYGIRPDAITRKSFLMVVGTLLFGPLISSLTHAQSLDKNEYASSKLMIFANFPKKTLETGASGFESFYALGADFMPKTPGLLDPLPNYLVNFLIHRRNHEGGDEERFATSAKDRLAKFHEARDSTLDKVSIVMYYLNTLKINVQSSKILTRDQKSDLLWAGAYFADRHIGSKVNIEAKMKELEKSFKDLEGMGDAPKTLAYILRGPIKNEDTLVRVKVQAGNLGQMAAGVIDQDTFIQDCINYYYYS